MHLRLLNCDSAIHVTACAQQFGDLGISVYLFVNAMWPFDLYFQFCCFCDIKRVFIRDTPSSCGKTCWGMWCAEVMDMVLFTLREGWACCGHGPWL